MSFFRIRDVLILRALFSAKGDFVSRKGLALAAGISQNELEMGLSAYLEIGYPIEIHPQRGISLKEPPDIWCAEEIIARCPVKKGGIVWDPLLLVETSSTNDVAREQARKGAKAGFVVAAVRQTKGRGRLGRSWESPQKQGLYLSILLRPTLAVAEAGQLTILSSVATVDAVEAVSGLRPQIKWPNDLMLGGRKLAGLLIETEPDGLRLAFAVIGIGINVRHDSSDFSPELGESATSLFLATGQLYRRADLLVALLHAFERRLGKPFAETREAWAASSLTLGQQVTLTTLRGRKHGQALGLDASGALLLRNGSGEVETVTAGDMQAV
jgi:BirA family biotin operon repressor/biotin-[acetyl-CoA-carboxylase] ligase